MSQAATIDPTQTREPEVTDVYESTHGNIYQVVFINDEAVFLKDQQKQNGRHIYRPEARSAFEDMIDQGRMEHKPDSDVDMATAPDTDWSEVDLIGEKTSERLNERGFSNPLEIQTATDEELLDVSGLGQKGLRNLREYI